MTLLAKWVFPISRLAVMILSGIITIQHPLEVNIQKTAKREPSRTAHTGTAAHTGSIGKLVGRAHEPTLNPQSPFESVA